jgi:hypothetical protein
MPTELIVALVSSLFTAVIGPIAVNIVKNKIENKNKKDLLSESLKENTIISEKLEKIREEYSADRAWIVQFHNGGNFYPSGKSIQKFSMCYESVDRGINSIQSSFQNIPISLFSKSINYLLENDILAVSDFKDKRIETYGLEYTANEYGCKSIYMVSIKTIDGKFIGTLGIEYTKRKHIQSVDEINELLVEATTIGGVLYNKK